MENSDRLWLRRQRKQRLILFVVVCLGLFFMWDFYSWSKGDSNQPSTTSTILHSVFRATVDDLLLRSDSYVDKEFKILSWNIWLGEHYQEERMKSIADEIKQHKPHFIALQELTPELFSLLNADGVLTEYHTAPTKLLVPERYFVALFSKIRYANSISKEFEGSYMGRNLLYSFYNLRLRHRPDAVPFVLATSHFENLIPRKLERRVQYLKTLKTLSSLDNVCFIGDTNMDERIDGELCLPDGWFDAWLVARGVHDNGFTWDPSINLMIKNKEMMEGKRYDRMYCKLKDFDLRNIEITGKKKIVRKEPSNKIIYPSHHFGLLATLVALDREKIVHGGVKHHHPCRISQ